MFWDTQLGTTRLLSDSRHLTPVLTAPSSTNSSGVILGKIIFGPYTYYIIFYRKTKC